MKVRSWKMTRYEFGLVGLSVLIAMAVLAVTMEIIALIGG